jgi:hypothetical protein
MPAVSALPAITRPSGAGSTESSRPRQGWRFSWPCWGSARWPRPCSGRWRSAKSTAINDTVTTEDLHDRSAVARVLGRRLDGSLAVHDG